MRPIAGLRGEGRDKGAVTKLPKVQELRVPGEPKQLLDAGLISHGG